MTNEQLIQKFNPATLGNLTAEDVEIMRNLTTDQIDVLAKAYPNQPHRKAYLRLYDKNVPAAKQLYSLSTWQNLRNLRKFQSKNNLVAWDAFNLKASVSAPVKSMTPVAGAQSPRKKVVDLTPKEAAAELQKVTGPAPVKIEAPEPIKQEPAPTPEPEATAGPENIQAPVTEKVKADKPGAQKATKTKTAGEKKDPENKPAGDIPADQDFGPGEAE